METREELHAVVATVNHETITVVVKCHRGIAATTNGVGSNECESAATRTIPNPKSVVVVCSAEDVADTSVGVEADAVGAIERCVRPTQRPR